MNQNQEQLLDQLCQQMKQVFCQESSGHDWWHLERVSRMAKKLALSEGADPFICQVAALVHDYVDDKLFADVASQENQLKIILDQHGLTSTQIEQIMDIIQSVSYKGGFQTRPLTSLEAKVVQDADRLDALGAIGIARTMAYSGAKGRVIHDPTILVHQVESLADYRSGQDTAILHFYQKLLHLKDLMNTPTAYRVAEQRHHFLEAFLNQFYREWEGQDLSDMDF
ncbi:HD domain-containing protein [Vaginisenegalia massiliensis]|uniref:HD domain-containing protein n=1 Tax=Vaginisenegalia massiliensis TaxID=2058294 RepID=UPI000F52F299|nr:HD domain-containing protein [Vaginisenegalia massiliensis]